MGAFIDIASGVLSEATRRVEVAAQNVANITTAGYKRQIPFSAYMDGQNVAAQRPVAIDFAPGAQVKTGNPFDLAIMGSGFFAVSAGSGAFYTRAGQFQRAGDGRVVNAQGFALQVQGGGDLTIKDGAVFHVSDDGTVVEDGQPKAKLDIVALNDPASVTYATGGLLDASQAGVSSVEVPVVRQGLYEASNVSDGDEMVSIMQALRQAETGQKLVSVYDDLMGRVLESFGQSGAS